MREVSLEPQDKGPRIAGPISLLLTDLFEVYVRSGFMIFPQKGE